MFKDLRGLKFGRWSVLDQAESKVTKGNRRIRYWTCECKCGTVRDVKEQSLTNGKSKSCGCLHSEIMADVGKIHNRTHGLSNTRLYAIYRHMRNRCYNTKDTSYPRYGGRGITICNEWSSFDAFAKWALSNGYSDNLSIDRIDTNLGYSPENCRWADNITQSTNRRNTHFYDYKGETHSIAEWARIYNMNYKKLWKRLHTGWTIEKALTT